MSEESETMEILNQLDEGQIDVDAALERISEQPPPTETNSIEDESSFEVPKRFGGWWIFPMSIGFILTIGGLGLASLEGWWWLLAVPMLLLGVFFLLFGLISIWAPWVHVRIDTGQDEWPRKIVISLPLPISLVSWFLRTFGRYIPVHSNMAEMDLVQIGAMLDAMKDSISREEPLFVEVQDQETGEHVTVYIG